MSGAYHFGDAVPGGVIADAFYPKESSAGRLMVHPDEIPAMPSYSLVMKDDAQERTVDLEFTVVFNKPQLAEAIHEVAYP
jgi:hypothetical protein